MESAQLCNTPAGRAGGDPRWSTRWLDVPRGNRTAEEEHLDSTEDSQGTNVWVSLPMFFHKYFFLVLFCFQTGSCVVQVSDSLCS